MSLIRKAFVLGAGLGTRLRPLTERMPKPMIPLWNKPLLTYAFDHLRADLGVGEILVNTHHCPEAYDLAFPGGDYGGIRLGFRHEPVLLDTAGGIDNVRDWLPTGEESFVVYNGDILTDLPLDRAFQAHAASDALVTMVLRSSGDALQVAWDRESGRVADIRNALGRGGDLPRYQFTGVYFVRPSFLDHLAPGKIESVILPFLEVMRTQDGIGGVVIDEGRWSDLGNRTSYLDASVELAEMESFPRYGRQSAQVRLHPSARIASSALVDSHTVIGEHGEVGEGAVVTDCILWPGSRVAPGASLTRCVVREGEDASGEATDRDF
ncbi:MAG: NTP transferase domain-containing protein [Verrucomicrobiae bacterium]|nr:NTP transferase domain-containing protein [Verrucomicrobiae bacterium]